MSEETFKELLNTAELRKVDFKQSQYRLDNDQLKSQFVKDMLCMANASGEDGYILLGVKEKPRKVVGISHHYDSAKLAQIVAGVIEEPIHFEYFPIKYKSMECALLYIPLSNARPHWPKKNYGILKKHVFYTRRASGNVEASLSEIRAMFMSAIRFSDVAQSKAKKTPYVIDELANMDIDDRELTMYKMLKSIAPKVHLTNYYAIHSSYVSGQIGALVANKTTTAVYDYAIFMYPLTAKLKDLILSHRHVDSILGGYRSMKVNSRIKKRLERSRLVHIAYKTTYTKALETKTSLSIGGWFANAWHESWGSVIKWGQPTGNERYEFFLPNISSKAELKDCLEQFLIWADTNIK
jgi:hypothetical protein